MNGIAYRYCGFNARVRLHLIHKRDFGNFTGVLLDDATGHIQPAGQYVSFAPDLSKYFATVQPDGLDGEEWYVYARDGTLLWKGLSGLSEKHPTLGYDYFVATLEHPRWTAHGQLQARLTCAIGAAHRSATVTLTRQADGWEWLPSIACPKAQ